MPRIVRSAIAAWSLLGDANARIDDHATFAWRQHEYGI